jgi:hypothetical protein
MPYENLLFGQLAPVVLDVSTYMQADLIRENRKLKRRCNALERLCDRLMHGETPNWGEIFASEAGLTRLANDVGGD